MKPVNNKSLLAFVFGQMEKLDQKQISEGEAKAQAALAKQANNIMTLEHNRAKIKMELHTFNKENGTNIPLRDIESKGFE